MKLTRSIERWAKCSPDVMSEMSVAAICFAFQDARHDIAALTASHAALLAALEHLLYDAEWAIPSKSQTIDDCRAAIKTAKELRC